MQGDTAWLMTFHMCHSNHCINQYCKVSLDLGLISALSAISEGFSHSHFSSRSPNSAWEDKIKICLTHLLLHCFCIPSMLLWGLQADVITQTWYRQQVRRWLLYTDIFLTLTAVDVPHLESATKSSAEIMSCPTSLCCSESNGNRVFLHRQY